MLLTPRNDYSPKAGRGSYSPELRISDDVDVIPIYNESGRKSADIIEVSAYLNINVVLLFL